MEPQVVIHTVGGDYRVDLAKQLDKATRHLVAEADSFEWHGGRQDVHRDYIRYNERVRAHGTMLRFSWEHVMYERQWISEIVADLYRRHRLHNSEPAGRKSRSIAA